MKKLIFLFLLTIFFLMLTKKTYAYSFDKPPNRIIIPSVGINLPVTTTGIVFTTWEVSLSGASFGDSTTLPGNRGNTVVFGHARVGLFKDLPGTKVGDLVYIFTPEDLFVYKVKQTMIVNPEDIWVIQPTQDYTLTLYTCTGDNWSKRFIVKAKLVNPLPPVIN